jgi:hypothetical protein
MLAGRADIDIWAVNVTTSHCSAMTLAMSVSAVLVAAAAAVTLLLPGRTALRPAPAPEA